MLFIIKECRFLGVCGDAKRVCLWVFVDVHELYILFSRFWVIFTIIIQNSL